MNEKVKTEIIQANFGMMLLWYASKYATKIKLSRENERSPGMQEIPRDVPYVQFT